MPDEVILIIFLVLGLLGLSVVLGIIALVKVSTLRREVDWLLTRLARVERGQAGAPPPAPAPPLVPVRPPPKAPPAWVEEAPSPVARPVAEARPAPAEPASSAWKGFEQKLGQRWLIWVGVVLILVGLGFFVRQAFTYMGPEVRVTAGILLAVALAFSGDRSLRRGWRIFGHGLIGAGLGAFYISLYAASAPSIYGLIPPKVGFAAMVLCTVAGMTLALLHDAVVIAIFTILGGFLTPVLVSTGQNSRDALFAYLLVLDLGVMAVAFFRKWMWLDALAFLGTVALYIGWFSEYYSASQLARTLPWLGGFWAVFLVLPFVYHLRRGECAPVQRFAMAMSNALFGFVGAYQILHDEYLFTMGFVALGMTAAYVALGALSRARVPQDVKQPLGFLAMAVGFLVLAAPIQFKAHGVVLAWSVEAPVLLFFGYRYRYLPLRVMAFLVLVLVSLYGASEAWPEHAAMFLPVLNRWFLAAVGPALGAAAYALVHQREKATHKTDVVMKQIAACGAGFMALVMLHAEFSDFFRLLPSDTLAHGGYYTRCFYAALWTVGAAAYAVLGIRLGSKIARGVGVGVLGIATAMLLYLTAEPYPEKFLMFANLRAGAMLFSVAGVFAAAALYRRLDEADPWRRLGPLLTWVGGVLLVVVLSVESYQFCLRAVDDWERSRWLAQMSLSVIWGLYALAVLAVGILKRFAPVRYCALAFFGVTALKVLLFDTSNLQEIYRWIAFLAVGFLFIAGAYLYYRLEKRITSTDPEAAK